MSMPPPLAPLDREEFERRWRDGARTLREIDPELWAYQRPQRICSRLLFAIGIPLWIVTMATMLYAAFNR